MSSATGSGICDRPPEPSPQTIEELLASVRGLVVHEAKAVMKLAPADLDDVISDGWVGAVKAANSFEPERGWAFHTYARHRIRGEMIDGLRRMDYLGRTERLRVQADMAAADAAGESYTDKRSAVPLSIDMPIAGNEDGGAITLASAIVDPDKAFDDRLADGELLDQVMTILGDRHRLLLELRYWHDIPLTAVGEMWGVTASRMSQLHTEAIHLLQLECLRRGVTTHRMLTELRAHTKRSHQSRFTSPERKLLFGDPLSVWTEE